MSVSSSSRRLRGSVATENEDGGDATGAGATGDEKEKGEEVDGPLPPIKLPLRIKLPDSWTKCDVKENCVERLSNVLNEIKPKVCDISSV